MVSVDVQKKVKNQIQSSDVLFMATEGRWYSVGSSDLCDILSPHFSPDDGLKISAFRGFIFVRIGSQMRFGFSTLEFALGRNVQVSLSLLSECVRYDREALRPFFDSFSYFYSTQEYQKLRRSVVVSSQLLQDFSLPEDKILSEITSQISAQIHVLILQVGMEISKFFDLALALLCDVSFEGPFFGHLNDELITEVVVNGLNGVWVERVGQWEKVDFPFHDWSSFENWLLFQSSFANSDIFGSGVFSDFVMRSGVRVHVCHSPVARSEGYVSMRRHRGQGWKLCDLRNSGFMTENQMRQLEHALESRMNIIVVGPTSSGKTTLLGALVASCINGERVLILEDTPELRVQHNHVVYMQTVQGASGDSNNVDLNDLVRNALRMRPDRIVVGECRGDEVFALLNALQTGHTGSLCTLHAKSAQQAIARLQTLLQHAEPSISDAVANKLISLGLDLIVCVTRSPTGERRIEEICDIQTLLFEA